MSHPGFTFNYDPHLREMAERAIEEERKRKWKLSQHINKSEERLIACREENAVLRSLLEASEARFKDSQALIQAQQNKIRMLEAALQHFSHK